MMTEPPGSIWPVRTPRSSRCPTSITFGYVEANVGPLFRDERQCMSGNATHRYRDVAILSVCGVDAPHVVTSDEFDGGYLRL